MRRASLSSIIYLFRRCLSRKTCRDGAFHISLVPGTVTLQKHTQPWHCPSSTVWKPHLANSNREGSIHRPCYEQSFGFASHRKCLQRELSVCGLVHPCWFSLERLFAESLIWLKRKHGIRENITTLCQLKTQRRKIRPSFFLTNLLGYDWGRSE